MLLTTCGTGTCGKRNIELDRVRLFVHLSVVLVAGCTLERATSVHHIFTDDKNCSLYDCSTDQVCPLI